jgi:hypothetical protein
MSPAREPSAPMRKNWHNHKAAGRRRHAGGSWLQCTGHLMTQPVTAFVFGHACASVCSRALGCPGDRRSRSSQSCFLLFTRPASTSCGRPLRCVSVWLRIRELSALFARSHDRIPGENTGRAPPENSATSSVGRQDLLRIAAFVCVLVHLTADEGGLCRDRPVWRPSAFSRPAELVDAAGESGVLGDRFVCGVFLSLICCFLPFFFFSRRGPGCWR